MTARFEFLLPDLGEGLQEAEIVNWLVSTGDAVAEDQPLAEVETAKATVEIPSPVAGTVVEVGGAVGSVVEVGSLLVAFGVPTDGSEPVTPEPVTPEPAAPEPKQNRLIAAAPSTRRYAVEVGIDLSAVEGTGPHRRILRSDVERAAGAARPRPSVAASPTPFVSSNDSRQAPIREDHVEKLSGLRREIARTMDRSWRSIPHVGEFREVDATRLLEAQRAWRAAGERSARLTLLPLLIVACARALRRNPIVNATIDVEAATVTHHGRIDIAVAMATDEGLVAPVVRDVDHKGVLAIADAIVELSAAARARKLRLDQIGGSTFTISNFGSYGTWLGTPIINPPEVAIVGFGRVRDRVVAVDGAPAVRPILPIAVSADHRLVDGDVLARFLDDVERAVLDPYLLIGPGE